MGFKNCTSDPCLFAYHSKRGSCIVGCYVDDIICAYSSKAVLDWFSSQFIASDTNPSGFRAKHMGPLKWFLRVAVDQEEDFTVAISQTTYIEKMLDKFIPSHKVNGIKHAMPCNPRTFNTLTGAKSDEERAKEPGLSKPRCSCYGGVS